MRSHVQQAHVRDKESRHGRAVWSSAARPRLKQVKDRCGLGRSTIYARIKEGTFPSPILLGARAVGWIEQSITDWIEQQIADSREIKS